MGSASLANAVSFGSLMSVLRDGVWLAHDYHSGGIQVFPKQEYPVLVVPPEVTGDEDGRLATAIGVMTVMDWRQDLPSPVRVDGRRYTHYSPVRVTRLAPFGEGVPVRTDMVNRYATIATDGQPARLMPYSVAPSMETYTALKVALRRVVRPLAKALPGYEALADRQPPDPWSGLEPLPDVELTRTMVYQLLVEAGAGYDPPLRRDDEDRELVRRLALDRLCATVAGHAPDAPPERILATVVDAYPAFFDECTRRLLTR
jgi:hypothetical protein